ncbi:Phospholipid/glycerol acyltransferase [Rhodovulum sp. PH10]|uniref:lysophospholipid acyltransferase family protein n=1 Tax=Rhodovulum sp. PH10 TaxID=1187851 RepID=UPI00027C2C78|nr:lysophospholipid acyltransferase family protein [Rhodovulum sp. PH10]EJW10600.1 Phospholipid/glycerol acyltransferase [Rhodovulum sp. PH10]
MPSLQAVPDFWHPAAARELLRWPLPYRGFADRCLLRAIALAGRGRVLGIGGLQNIRAGYDPFILALNHSTRTEAVLVPALLMLHRGGRMIHFMADWNFSLIPGVGFVYRRAQILTVTAKPAKPAFLNRLRPLYRGPVPVLDVARDCLARGRAVGVFPEGTVNRDPHRLLAGRRSAALLSLETGAPVVPVGIRFPTVVDRQIRDRDPMEVLIGAPLVPPRTTDRVSPAAVKAWHAVVMGEIARLSGKRWPPADCSPDDSLPRASSPDEASPKPSPYAPCPQGGSRCDWTSA